jgi:ribonuclease-3
MLNEELIKKKHVIKNYLYGLWVDISAIKNENLMISAFVHKSYAADFNDNIDDNERLEFLGDAILWWVVAKNLFLDYQHEAESKLTLYKIALVREETLAEISKKIWLDKMIMLWKWEDKMWWRNKDVILCDVLEALIWYIYIDLWVENVEKFIKKYIYVKISSFENINIKSYKTILQEYVQKHHKDLPRYEDVWHEIDKKWNISIYKTLVYINDDIVWEWFAHNKKKAQEEAAKVACLKLNILSE